MNKKYHISLFKKYCSNCPGRRKNRSLFCGIINNCEYCNIFLLKNNKAKEKENHKVFDTATGIRILMEECNDKWKI